MDTDHDKLIRLEEGQNALKDEVAEIKNNHLAHLSEDMKEIKDSLSSLEKKFAYWSGGLVVAVWIVERFL